MYGCKHLSGSCVEQVSFNTKFNVQICTFIFLAHSRFFHVTWTRLLHFSVTAFAALLLSDPRSRQLEWWCGGSWALPGAIPWRARTVGRTKASTKWAKPPQGIVRRAQSDSLTLIRPISPFSVNFLILIVSTALIIAIDGLQSVILSVRACLPA